MTKSIYLEIFEEANEKFLINEFEFLFSKVNDRAWYDPLSRELVNAINYTEFSNYHLDIEYNLNGDNIKTIVNSNGEVKNINCDIILHSRGKKYLNDNLIE